MKNLLFFSLVLIPFVTKSQSKINTDTFTLAKQGIHFESGLSWRQIQEKAIAKNKYVFLDCFATWCLPCKQMENEIFSKDNVGKYFNSKFISVKVQMDTSEQDDDNTKSWYRQAHNLMNEYKVYEFPTYLFFSPEGKLIHRGVGEKRQAEFITLATEVLDTSKQYYHLLENYKHGIKDSTTLRYLAFTALSLGDKDISNAIAKDYKEKYLEKLDVSGIGTRENINFIMQFSSLINSKDVFFGFFYSYPNKADEIVGIRGFSQKMIDFIITKEEINTRLYSSSNSGKDVMDKPDWNKITTIIAKKYNKNYADRTVVNAQIRWYRYKKDWPNLLACNLKKIDKYGLDTAGIGKYLLNDMIWESVFEHNNDKDILKKGIEWMEIILKAMPSETQAIDTYANLLYKVGRTNEALEWEAKAAKFEEESAIKSKRIPDKIYQETLAKMRRGEATWQNE